MKPGLSYSQNKFVVHQQKKEYILSEIKLKKKKKKNPRSS